MTQWETVEPEIHYLTDDSRSATDRIEPERNSESRLRASGKCEFEFVPRHQVFLLPVFNCFFASTTNKQFLVIFIQRIGWDYFYLLKILRNSQRASAVYRKGAF